MGGKHTNNKKIISPDILTFTGKVFGFFLLLFFHQNYAQVSVSGGATIYDGKNEMNISQVSKDDKLGHIYIEEGTVILGGKNISGKDKIVSLSKTPKNSFKKNRKVHKKNTVHKKIVSEKTETGKQKYPAIVAKFETTESEGTFTSIQNIFKNGICPQTFHIDFLIAQYNQYSFIRCKEESLQNIQIFETQIKESYSERLSVRPPPAII